MLAQLAQCVIAQMRRFFRLDYDAPGRRFVQAADYLQKRAFAAAARAGNRDKFALADA